MFPSRLYAGILVKENSVSRQINGQDVRAMLLISQEQTLSIILFLH
jgi:hypothetical protein